MVKLEDRVANVQVLCTYNSNNLTYTYDDIGTANSTLTRPSRNTSINNTTLTTIVGSPSTPAPSSRSGSPSPPPSIVSTVSSTAGLTNSTSTTPLANSTQRRPRFLDFLPAGTRPLSPIHSSAETTPCESPSSRQKSLNLSNFLHPLNKLSSFTSNNSLSKSSRAHTPTPGEIRPIYEAESPDELALVDAAYAYNVKLVKRYSLLCISINLAHVKEIAMLNSR